MIWGYPYFRKPPYVSSLSSDCLEDSSVFCWRNSGGMPEVICGTQSQVSFIYFQYQHDNDTVILAVTNCHISFGEKNTSSPEIIPCSSLSNFMKLIPEKNILFTWGLPKSWRSETSNLPSASAHNQWLTESDLLPGFRASTDQLLQGSWISA